MKFWPILFLLFACHPSPELIEEEIVVEHGAVIPPGVYQTYGIAYVNLAWVMEMTALEKELVDETPAEIQTQLEIVQIKDYQAIGVDQLNQYFLISTMDHYSIPVSLLGERVIIDGVAQRQMGKEISSIVPIEDSIQLRSITIKARTFIYKQPES